MAHNPLLALATKVLPDGYDYLAPDRSEIRLLLEVQGGGLAHCTLPAGAMSSAVRHRTVEEIWYVLSGYGQIWRRGSGSEQITRLSPGVCITLPVGTEFQFRAEGSESLRLLIATIPRWPGAHEAVPVTDYWRTEPHPEPPTGAEPGAAVDAGPLR